MLATTREASPYLAMGASERGASLPLRVDGSVVTDNLPSELGDRGVAKALAKPKPHHAPNLSPNFSSAILKFGFN